MKNIKIVLLVLAILIVVPLLGYGLKALFLPVKTVTTQIDSASDIIEKTYDADNAIYNYEWFKSTYEKIDALEKQANRAADAVDEHKELYGAVAGWDWTTKEEYSRLNTIKLGLQNQYDNVVAEYNARANMANRNVFKNKLPLSIDKIIW